MEEVDALWTVTPDDGLPTLCRDSLLPVLRLYVTDPSHLSRTRGDVCGYPAEALRNRDRVGSAGITSLGDFDFRPMLRTIRAPTLVIAGELDRVVPAQVTMALAARIAGAKSLLLQGVGHVTVMQAAQRVADAIAAFLSIQEAADASRS